MTLRSRDFSQADIENDLKRENKIATKDPEILTLYVMF